VADTGYAQADAENDFQRARRQQLISYLTVRLRGLPPDAAEMLVFDEVVDALGRTGERSLGLQIVGLGGIVGSVDRARDFDRWFHPRARVDRQRWIQLDRAKRIGETVPPIDLYQVGDLYFVRDGHHRVSVALALHLRTIDGFVTETTTRVDTAGIRHRGDLVVKHERHVFLDRVALPGILVTRPRSYTALCESVEAWGYRLMQREARYLDRDTIARRWHAEEFEPVVRTLREAGLANGSTDAEAYLWLADQRYRLPRAHRWPDDVIVLVRR
jgi:hypothetical protein